MLINEIRSLSIDSTYPVNFLLFDYKGGFADPAIINAYKRTRNLPIAFDLILSEYTALQPQKEKGKELQEIREAISGLQKGELIIKDALAMQLGMGRKFKKIKVRHLI